MIEKMAELLAPAGSFESMKAAVAAGADACYMGGLRFGARAYAENPDDLGLLRAIDFMHLHGKRLYLTVNTLLKEKELNEELVDWLAPAYEQGLDAVLVQDLGVLSVLRHAFPDLELHISTQMAVGAPEGARIAEELGASRLVLPRELSLKEIRAIRDGCGLELEAFIHGALCYSTSGQCLLSSMIGGRSGNRGRCAGPCRLPVNGRYLLNLKDLCTLDILPEILTAGVSSLKIEGRMKGPRYTAGVVSVYRHYLDRIQDEGMEEYSVREEDRQLLLELFDRGGFTEGYYRKHNGADMIFPEEKPKLRVPDEAKMAAIDQAYLAGEPQEEITGVAVLETGKPASLTVRLREAEATVTGPEVLEAKNRPLTAAEAEERLKKTGGTPFRFQNLETVVSENAFLPVGAVNALRREALEALEQAVTGGFRREWSGAVPADSQEIFETAEEPAGSREIWASYENPALLPVLLKEPSLTGVYLPADRLETGRWKETVEKVHAAGKKAALALPFVLRKEAEDFLKKQKEEWRAAGFDACLVRNLDTAGLLREWAAEEGKAPFFGERIFDAGLYTWNREAIRQMRALGGEILTFPYELRYAEMKERGIGAADELVVYGRIPVMTSAQCTAKTTGKCRKESKERDFLHTPGFRMLTDRKRADFLEDSRCRFCQTVIYNSVPLWLTDRIPEEVKRVRFAFTDETPEETARILREAAAGKAVPPAAFTRGHFTRGVE